MGELRRKRMANEPLTAQDSAVMQKIRQWREQQGGGQGLGGGQGGAAPNAAGTSGAGGGDGPQMQLPPGVTQEQVRAIFRKQFSGEQLTPQEQAIATQVRRQFQSAGGGMGAGGSSGSQGRRRFGEGNNYQFGGNFIVFVLKGGKPAPMRVRTGLTDMDYSEVVSGIGEKDTVLLLPSASLVQSQTEMRNRMQQFAGSAVPGMQQGSRAGAAGGPGAGPRAGGR